MIKKNTDSCYLEMAKCKAVHPEDYLVGKLKIAALQLTVMKG